MEPEPKYSVGDRVVPLLMPMIGAIMETQLETRTACGSNAGRSQCWFYRVQWPIAHADSDGWYAEDGLALVSSEPDVSGRRLPKSLGMGKNGPADLSEREDLDQSAEIAELRRQVKHLGKEYGKASRTIGELRRGLALARLYRVCWAKRSASDCAACRSVFGPESAENWLLSSLPKHGRGCVTPEPPTSRVPRRTGP